MCTPTCRYAYMWESVYKCVCVYVNSHVGDVVETGFHQLAKASFVVSMCVST